MVMGLDGLVGVRGEGGRGMCAGREDGVDTWVGSLASAFSSSLWAMDSQLFERSGWTMRCEVVVATERAEEGRDAWGGRRVGDGATAEGGRGRS